MRTYTLGQFFAVWGVLFTRSCLGVLFTRSCLGGYCAAGERRLRHYFDGAASRGDPTTLPLASHQYAAEIPGDLYTGTSPDAS